MLSVHLAWEPRLASEARVAEIAAGRSRLAHLAGDLARLGIGTEQIALARPCPLVADLPSGGMAALGALYVIEGSTLGGEVIARTLRQASWVPPHGLTSFRPYGAAAGRMWREFKDTARRLTPPESWREVEAGAVGMFDLLRRWLPADVSA